MNCVFYITELYHTRVKLRYHCFGFFVCLSVRFCFNIKCGRKQGEGRPRGRVFWLGQLRDVRTVLSTLPADHVAETLEGRRAPFSG